MAEHIVVSGKRKRAIARAVIKTGSGEILYNNRNYQTLSFADKLRFEEPLKIAQSLQPNFSIHGKISVRGGGENGQLEAARLALGRAIVKLMNSAAIKKAFLQYDRGLIVADTRRKESRKPGDSKARARRQKSYR
jgi:small subunit ribosomal protein S9